MSCSLNIEIRPVTPPDVPAISLLAREIWQATYPGIITQDQIDFMLEQRYGHERLYDDLEDADDLIEEIESLEPPADLSEAVEELVRATLLLADVSRPVENEPARSARSSRPRPRR